MDKQELIIITRKLINSKKIITPKIKLELIQMGFKETRIGAQKTDEINSREMKIDFKGYDLAVGIAARPVSYGCQRLFKALVINLDSSI